MQPAATSPAARSTVELDPSDTIAAPASAPGPAARAIVRLSGPSALSIAAAGFSSSTLEAGRVRRRDGQPPGRASSRLPGCGLPCRSWWRSGTRPRSYTGQDVAEIHLTGSVPLVSLVLSHCFTLGARPAEPGEFTLRAFLSGASTSPGPRPSWASSTRGTPPSLKQPCNNSPAVSRTRSPRLRDRLLDLVAHLEANLDFTEEPDVDPLSRATLVNELEESAETLEPHRQAAFRARADFRPRTRRAGRTTQRRQEPALQRTSGPRPGDRLASVGHHPRLHRGDL